MSLPITYHGPKSSSASSITQPPSATIPVRATLGQPPSPFAGGVPQDVVNELMYWVDRTDGRNTGIRSLGCVSRGWNQALWAYATSGLSAEARSIQRHRQATDWTRQYLDKCGCQPGGFTPTDGHQLRQALNHLSVPGVSPGHRSLFMDSDSQSAFTGDWVQAFREYQGESLSISLSATPWSVAALHEAERALPANVALGIYFLGSSLGEAESAEALQGLCDTERVISLYFDLNADPSEQPGAWNAVINAIGQWSSSGACPRPAVWRCRPCIANID